MAPLLAIAQRKLGQIAADRAYCLKISSVLGGAYEADNIGHIALAELISASGELARQIDEVPDGEPVCLRTSD